MHSQSTTDVDAEKSIKDLLYKILPNSERHLSEEDLRWNFILDKHSIWNKKIEFPKRKKKFLTRRERTHLGLLKLPKQQWYYEDLRPLREMWNEYMRKNLASVAVPHSVDPFWGGFNIALGKADYSGAVITVVRSKVPSLIGMKGTVVLETKCSFNIVTHNNELKIILKKPSVFVISLDNMKFTIFGKHMLTRPAERSVKKVKLQLTPDL